MTIEAILFDLWGTLIIDPPERSRPRQVWRALNVQTILRDNGVEMEFGAIDSALVHASATLTAIHDTARDVSASGRVDLFFAHLSDDRMAALNMGARWEIEAAITSMQADLAPLRAEGAVEVLEAVKALGLKTALVSNAGFTTAPHLRTLLEDFELAPLLDAMVFSDELRLAKPEPALFETALAALSVQAENAAFVGDAPHNDIYGAQGAGLFAVQIGRKTHANVKPQAQIDALDELIPALRRAGLLPDEASERETRSSDGSRA
jgi:HAD superfamily hydrolase (TIGR01549 family)